MTRDAALRAVAEYWLGRANAALLSAASELTAGRFDFAANRAYYAAFYAASAVLLSKDRKFVKHSGVRGAVHRDLVKPGLLEIASGKAYDRLFEARQAADYLELFELDQAQAAELVDLARGIVDNMRRMYAGEVE